MTRKQEQPEYMSYLNAFNVKPERLVFNFFFWPAVAFSPLFFLYLSTPAGNITIDRFFIFLSIAATFAVYFIYIRKVKANAVLATILVFFFYIILNRAVYSSSIFPKFNMMILVMMVFGLVVFFGERYHKQMVSALNVSFIILTVISAYSFVFFLQNLYLPVEMTIADYLPFIETVEYEHLSEVNQSYIFPRLSLPYPTPPQLSIVMAAYAIFYSFEFDKQRKTRYKIFSFIAVIIAILTISRSGVFPMFLLLIVKNFKLSRIKYLVIGAFVMLGLAFLVSIMLPDLILVLLERVAFDRDPNGVSPHMYARLMAIDYFQGRNFIEYLFGVGLGNYPENHSHMTYLTMLIEVGFIGLILFLIVFFSRPFLLIIHYLQTRKFNIDHKRELYMYALMGMGFLLYEFTFVVQLYFLMGLTTAISISSGKKENFDHSPGL